MFQGSIYEEYLFPKILFAFLDFILATSPAHLPFIKQ
jgi:hypothetical protein